jgi:hypothetical protein
MRIVSPSPAKVRRARSRARSERAYPPTHRYGTLQSSSKQPEPGDPGETLSYAETRDHAAEPSSPAVEIGA